MFVLKCYTLQTGNIHTGSAAEVLLILNPSTRVAKNVYSKCAYCYQFPHVGYLEAAMKFAEKMKSQDFFKLSA